MSQRPSLDPSLAATQEQLATLLDCAHELLTILSADGIVLHANAGSTRALGVPPDELVGRNLTAFVHPDDLNEIQYRLRRLPEVPKAVQKGRCTLRSKSGEWRCFEATISSCLKNS